MRLRFLTPLAVLVVLFPTASRAQGSLSAQGFGYPSGNDWLVDAVVSAAIAKFQSPEDHAAVLDQLEAAYRDVYSAWAAANAELNAADNGPAMLPPPVVNI